MDAHPDVDRLVPAVLYAAKSTEDTRGSIATQLADCRAAAEAEGRTVLEQFSDEAASGYRRSRGAGLTAAKDAATRERAELWVQHSDRLARGDGITADHLAEVWFALRRAGVRLRSVQDDSNLEDAIRVVLIGERNHEDSKRKSAATRGGLRRRKDRGQPVGAIPEGYTVETLVENGQAVTRRVVDEQRRSIVDRVIDGIEAGHTPGDIGRALNADRSRTRRGKAWTARRSGASRSTRRTTPAPPATRQSSTPSGTPGSWRP
jgi:DNA invertase Pin-like site-specific DNA recombinase